MQCSSCHLLRRPSPAQQLHNRTAPGRAAAGTRQPLQISCGLGLSRRSNWGWYQRLNDAVHSAEQAADNLRTSIRHSPPVKAADRLLQPLKSSILHFYGQYAEVYGEFTGDETKQKWKWSRQMAQETEFWRKVVNFFLVMVVTLLWEAVVPVSFVLAVAVPLFVNWVAYDRLIMNPIMVALLLIWPLKFIPGCSFRWFV